MKWNGCCPECNSDNVVCVSTEGEQTLGEESTWKCNNCGWSFTTHTIEVLND